MSSCGSMCRRGASPSGTRPINWQHEAGAFGESISIRWLASPHPPKRNQSTNRLEPPQSPCLRHTRIMHVDDSPTAIFLVINLRFAPLGCDLLATIFHGCVKGPSELRPRGISVDVNLRRFGKQLALGEQSHRV